MYLLKENVFKKKNNDWIQVEDHPIERYECKYLVPVYLLPEIRRYIRPYVHADSNALREGDIPSYTVNTIQLDSPDLKLHYAKENEALNRLKLRIRTYGKNDFTGPIFLEIKRKFRDSVIKSRASIPNEEYCPEIIESPKKYISFRSLQEEMNYLNFVRITRQIGARPILIIRYERESYMGINDDYSRITFDRKICYQMTQSFDFNAVHNRRWRPVDSNLGLKTDEPSLIMECKCKRRVPAWFLDLVKTFSLTQVGFCKYSTALRLELLHCGHEFSSGSENCVPASRW